MDMRSIKRNILAKDLFTKKYKQRINSNFADSLGRVNIGKIKFFMGIATR